MSDQYEFEGKSVDEAVEAALIELGLERDQVTVEVIRKGSRGLLGFGSESALVRIHEGSSNTGFTTSNMLDGTAEANEYSNDLSSDSHSSNPAPSSHIETPANDDDDAGLTTDSDALDVESERSAESIDDNSSSSYESDDSSYSQDDEDQELTSMAVDFLEELVYLMGYDADVNATWKEPEPDETEPCLMLSVDGEDLGSLIGRRGETLDSLQYLLRLMINQKIRNWRNIVVDVGGYKEKRSSQIVQLAERMAAQVIESGRAVSLEPMPANERRMVHLALRDHPDVYTESSGDSDRRKVHIMPKSLLD